MKKHIPTARHLGKSSSLEVQYITSLYQWLCQRVRERREWNYWEWNYWELRLQGINVKPHISIEHDKHVVTIMMDMRNATVRVVSEGRFRGDYDRNVKFELADPNCFDQIFKLMEEL